MPNEKEQVEAREEHAPAEPEKLPRGNILSEPDELLPDGDMPPPHPH